MRILRPKEVTEFPNGTSQKSQNLIEIYWFWHASSICESFPFSSKLGLHDLSGVMQGVRTLQVYGNF